MGREVENILPIPELQVDGDAYDFDDPEWFADGLDPEDLINGLTDQHSKLDSEDIIKICLKEAGRIPLLTHEEEISLAKRMEAGEVAKKRIDKGIKGWDDLSKIVADGDAAKDYLVRANGRLVVSIAKKYMDRGVPFLDLIQEGNLGAIRAADKFDYHLGFRFATYATWWIRQAVSRAVLEQGRTICVPVKVGDQINRLYRVTRDLEQELGYEPSPEQIAKRMGIDPEDLEFLQDSDRVSRPLSLSHPVGEDNDSLDELGDFLPDESPQPFDVVAERQKQEVIQETIGTLSGRQQQVVISHYGLDGQDQTYEKIGKGLGISRERARQINGEGVKKLRVPRISNKLRDWVE